MRNVTKNDYVPRRSVSAEYSSNKT